MCKNVCVPVYMFVCAHVHVCMEPCVCCSQLQITSSHFVTFVNDIVNSSSLLQLH